jgi:hypothetical protein
VLDEFGELARSAGASVVGTLTARLERPNPALLIGSGKLEEARDLCEATGADLVLVNHRLSPVQERNLEKALSRRVVDRTGLILDIFAQRARSHEGKLQVELAQLRHMATRLVRGWTHLDSQRGGAIGLRGPGETQLETDRRLLQKRVEVLQAASPRSRYSAPRCVALDCATRCRAWHWWVTPMPASRPCSTPSPVPRPMRPTSCSPRLIPPCDASMASTAAWWRWPIRLASCAICRMTWSRLSAPPCPKRVTRICCCT